MLYFLFGILNVLCKVNLISLIDFTDGGCIIDIICACLDFIVLITTDNICITGCIVSPNGKMILVDYYYNRRLVIFNDDGTLDKVIPCSQSYLIDVTYLDAP
jgi:hypothetical protein